MASSAALAAIFTAFSDVAHGLYSLPVSSPPLPSIVQFSAKSPSSFALSSLSAQQAPELVWTSSTTDSVLYAMAVTEKTVHDFTVKDIDGKDVSLGKFKGKVSLIVNVASKCGLTRTNYTQLSQIYEKYKDQGFEILAFPCNQFGSQEPGTNPEIKEFACSRFKAKFPIFNKVNVNGPNTAPIYQFLKSSTGGDPIQWNFEKFLVDKNGNVIKRYSPITSPFDIENDIQKLLTT